MSSQPDSGPDYLSYLIRLWRAQSGGAWVWRAFLEEPLTQEIYRFEDLQSLFNFLQAQTGQEGLQLSVGEGNS